MARVNPALAVFASLLLVACGDDDGADPDAGGGRDAGGAVDGGSDRDGGSELDAGAGDDAGPGPDAGPGTDAGPDPACALPAPIDEGVTWERTWYVDAAGPADGDGSEERPFQDVESALDAATPGTRILVRAGTYPPVSASGVQGEPGRPIAVVTEGAVVLDAGGSGTVLRLSDARYLVLEGLELRGAGVHGMNLDDGGSYDTPAEFIVLRGITIDGAGSGGNNDCIKMSGVDDFWILDSDVGGCDMGEIVDMVGCHRGLIHGNRFRSTVRNAIQAKGGSADTLVHGNLFEDIPGRAVNAGGSTGLEFFRPLDAPHEAARIRVVANVFVRGGSESGAPVAFVGCDACSFVHNTVIEPAGGWVTRILQETSGDRFVPSRDGVFANNLLVLNVDALRTFVNVGGGTAPESFTFANNLWWALDRDAGWSGPSYPAEIDEAGALVQEDPLLVDRAGGDYALQSGSPAIAAATAIDFPLPPGFDGRCYAEPAAIGAFPAP